MLISMELNDDHSEKVRYDYPDYPIYIRKGLLSHYPNYTAPNHWHDALEFIFVFSGAMKYNINGHIVLIQTGEGIIVNSGQMHFGFSRTKSECEFICVLLPPILLCGSYAFERDYILPVIQNTAMPYMLLTPQTPWHNLCLNFIRAFYENKDSAIAPLKITADFAALWTILFENMPKSPSEKSPQNRDLTIIKNMTGFIHKNYAKKMTLSDIARAGAVGQSKCCKLFHQYFSQSPIAYLIQYRLTKSVELLRDTDMSMTEIAFFVGFGNASYYAETFRKWLGQSPTAFKRQKSFSNSRYIHI